jgi:hypothetical protein
MSGQLHHLGRQDAGRAVECGEGLVQLGHVTTDGGLPLHQVGRMAGVGDVQGGLDTSDTPTHDHRGPRHWLLPGMKGFVQAHSFHGRTDQILGLRGGGVHVRMHPGTVLADVGHFQEVGVQAHSLKGCPESSLVHSRRAGSHDYPVHTQLTDIVADRLLAGVGAGVFVGAHYPHTFQLPRVGGYRLHIHSCRDVGSAIADIDADLHA